MYYCSNKEKASDQTIEKSNFSTQIYAAHEIFFNAWIKTNDPKLRQITIEAIGHFVNLIAADKLEADIQKIILGLLNLYKRHAELYVVRFLLLNLFICILKIFIFTKYSIEIF